MAKQDPVMEKMVESLRVASLDPEATIMKTQSEIKVEERLNFFFTLFLLLIIDVSELLIQPDI